MRKLFAILALFTLLGSIGGFGFTENARADQQIKSNLALDLVIVIDESASMSHCEGQTDMGGGLARAVELQLANPSSNRKD